jgi:hypothetical protein
MGRAGASEIVYPIKLALNFVDDIPLAEFDFAIARKLRKVREPARVQIVDNKHVVPLLYQPVTEVRSKKAGSTGYKYAHNQTSLT